MACNIERPTPQALFDRYQKLFSSTVLGGAAIIPESNEFYATAVNYAIAEEFYAIADQAWKETDPREACCTNLIDMASLDGVYPLPAVPAQGYVIVTGTAGTALSSPLDFTIGDLSFQTSVTAQQPTAIGTDGTATIRVRALTPGAAGNISTATGALVNIRNGVDQTVTVCGGTFCEGTDAEDCETFRSRYLRRLQYQPRATIQWIRDKLLEWPCATRALARGGSCCVCSDADDPCSDGNCDCSDCGGKLAFYVMFDNTFTCGIAPASVTSELQEWMFGSPQGYGLGQVEVGICGSIVPVTGFTVNVGIDVADCTTAVQLAEIETLITEYFGTLAPSEVLKTDTIRALATSVVGTSADVSAYIELADDTIGYGENGRSYTQGVSQVYVSLCNLEPDCDYMPCLGTVTVNSEATTQSGCT